MQNPSLHKKGAEQGPRGPGLCPKVRLIGQWATGWDPVDKMEGVIGWDLVNKMDSGVSESCEKHALEDQ